jgi:hypothetical protein
MKSFPLIPSAVLLAGVLCFASPAWSATLVEPPDALRPTLADPATYPDQAGFDKRWERIVTEVSRNDLSKWRRGYFSGGDPGKYLPGAAMARLLLDPNDAEARKYMNDDRSPKEHYHFAAINWARFLPLFGETLTADTHAKLAASAAIYSAYLNPSGTENHRTMSLCAANVLPTYLEGGRLAHKDREGALAEAKEKLRAYVKGLYAAGQGEWDSPTYLMFDLHGFLNIYDFSKDPETRLIAAAALDFFTASYALKYRDGIFGGPNQRGFYDKPFTSIADQTGWLWWGASQEPESCGNFLYAIHAATSSWRPNRILTALARKEISPLPSTQLNTKPNYWFGQQKKPVPGEYPETLYISRSFSMGSIWRGFGSQITRFQLVADSASGALSLSGGHPRKSDHTGKKLGELTWRDGGGRYDQSLQSGALYLCVSRIPEEESEGWTQITIPESVEPSNIDGKWVSQMGNAFVCVVPFGDASEVVAANGKIPRHLRISGRPSGFAVIAAEASAFSDLNAFAKETARRHKFDESRFRSDCEISVAIDGKDAVSLRHDPNSGLAQTTGIQAPSNAIFAGPFVRLNDSILEVSDGKAGYAVDFSGDLPAYRNLNIP